MLIERVYSSILDGNFNDQKMVRVVGDVPNPIRCPRTWLGDHVVSIELNLDEDDFAMRIMPCTVLAGQRAIVVTVRGKLKFYENSSDHTNESLKLKADPFVRKSHAIRIHPGQKVVIAAPADWDTISRENSSPDQENLDAGLNLELEKTP